MKVQELMDTRLDQRDKELCQLHLQSQTDGAELAVLSLQVQELISLVEARSKVVGRDLEEINGRFDRHRGEINCLKTREKDAKEKAGELGGFIIGAAHEAELFKSCLDRMEENVCRCGHTPSVVGEEFVSSEEEARTELSYASAQGSEYVAPPVENPIPISIPAPCHPCGSLTALPALEEITDEPTFICDNLDGLLREADEERASVRIIPDILNYTLFFLFLSSVTTPPDLNKLLNYPLCPLSTHAYLLK